MTSTISNPSACPSTSRSPLSRSPLSRLPVAPTLLGLLLSLCLHSPAAIGQASTDQQKRTQAATQLADVDEDFAFMGEYQGWISDACGWSCGIGLQVVAMGDGSFGGMYYAGGLPGTGWNRRQRNVLEGQRTADQVTLTSGGIQAQVQRGEALVTAYGYRGQLIKVHRQSPTLGMAAPPQARVLFDGTHTAQFKNGQVTEERLLQEGTELRDAFRDYTLHVEFQLPYMPHARGQGRSNSGLYLQSSYEVQILDSFGLEGVFNECGALYRYRQPDLNMCLPPLSWQTYDLTFRSPRFDASDRKIQNARITVLHNGVAIHNSFEIERKTGAGKQESPQLWPIKFQDHSNPVRFRNIWLIDLEARGKGGLVPIARADRSEPFPVSRGCTAGLLTP